MNMSKETSQRSERAFSLAVLNPKGKDKAQSFSDGAGEPTPDQHAPINFHAYAACVNGGFHRDADAALESGQPVLLLLRRDLKLCLKTLRQLKGAGRKVAVSVKETGAHQFHELLSEPGKLAMFKRIAAEADGCVAPTPFLVALYRSCRPSASPQTVEFIPTPYPVDDLRWGLLQASGGAARHPDRHAGVPGPKPESPGGAHSGEVGSGTAWLSRDRVESG